jgi:thiol:disulfide interchange protein DsbD
MSLTERIALSLQGSLASGQLWVALTAAFIGGLLTSFTPCVYPLIPITIRYFGGMQKAGRGKVVLRATVYVAGMILLYVALGMAFASSGKVFGSYLANPVVVVVIAAFCVAMGASMLGLFTLQLPAGLNTRLSQVGGQGVGGAFAMGLVSGLIAAPCTGPVLLVILTIIAAKGAPALGLGLMVAFGLGLGVPFLLLAIFSGALTRLPSGGGWMESVKIVLATAMFAVGVYFLAIAWPGIGVVLGAIPAYGTVALVLAVGGAVLAAVYLRRLERPGATPWKALSIVALTLAASIAVAARPAQPPAGVASADGPAQIVWAAQHGPAVERARAEKKPVMIDFGAEWCGACKELEHKTYVDPRIRAEAQRFVSIKIDGTEDTPEVLDLYKKYGVLGLPTVVFLDSSGAVLPSPRVTGFIPADAFLPLMKQVQ